MEIFQELTAVRVDEGQVVDDFSSFCGNMAIQTSTVLIAALLIAHKLNNFKKILKLLSKAERTKMMNFSHIIFSLMCYSWEIGKQRRKLNFTGSTHCVTQSLILQGFFLPSEIHYLLNVWGAFYFR